MYSNLPQNNLYYQYPYGQQQYVRTPQMDQNPGIGGQYNLAPIMTQPSNYIKGRPVASLEEARAAQIDFDGSLHVFTDVGNKKIYTKQINLDGTATLNTYSLIEEGGEAPTETPEYVTKEEFKQALIQIENLINSKEATKASSMKNF